MHIISLKIIYQIYIWENNGSKYQTVLLQTVTTYESKAVNGGCFFSFINVKVILQMEAT
jgi:hypothetical protein